MGNLQLYSVVSTTNAENKARLAPAHFNQPMVTQAPVVLTFCADFNRTTQWALHRKGNPGYNNFLSFLNAVSDTLLYCQTFCNMAEAQGLGCCYLGTTLYNPEPIIDVFKSTRFGNTRCNHHTWLARWMSWVVRSIAIEEYFARRNLSTIHSRGDRRILLSKRRSRSE